MATEKLSPEVFPTKAKPKRAALYCRVSTGDQHPETQLYDLSEFARQRGFEIGNEYTDTISGAKSKRPALDQLLADARRTRFEIVIVAAFDRLARNVRHFLEVLDEFNHLGITFISLRENIDTAGPLGRAMVVIVGAIAELERSFIVERVRAGMRRAKLEGRRIGRAPLDIDRQRVVADRRSGMSLTKVANKDRISRASVCRLVNEAREANKTTLPDTADVFPRTFQPIEFSHVGPFPQHSATDNISN
jgi:DNA invertase Pin-like site-specific DNA recombinase